jgi:hypothetical protein
MRALLLLLLVPLAVACQVSSADTGLDSVDVPGAADVAAPDDGLAKDPGAAGEAAAPDAAEGAPADVPAADLPEPDVPADAPADAPVDPGSPDVPADVPADVPVDPGTPDAPADVPSDPGVPEVPPILMPDPDQEGPWTVATIEASVTRGDRTTPVVARLPQRTDGKLSPVIVFLPGFQAKAAWYAGSMARLASHGFVVVGADPPAGLFSISHVEMAADVSAVLDWALAADGPLAGVVDASRVGATGHSLGGKVATMTAHRDARVTALLALDPVNGGSPLTGYSDDLPDIVPAEVAALTIPVGFQGETPSSEAQSFFSPACAPTDQNFATFFAASTLSPWRAAWDLLEAGHMDFVDESADCGVACTLCVRGAADPSAVRAASRTLLVAFYRRHFAADTAMDAWLTGAKLPAGVGVTHAP